VGATAEALGAADHGNVVVHAVRRPAGRRDAVGIELHVVGYEQIEASVAIVIQKAASRAPSPPGSRDAGFLGDVGKGAVAVIVIENVPAPIRYEQIVEAVVIVVAYAAALAPAGVSQAGLCGDVGERSVAVVVKQVAGGVLASRRLKGSAVHEENIEPAVVVVVEERGAAAHHLEEKGLLVGMAGYISRAQEAGFGGDVGEPDVGGFFFSLSAKPG